MSMMSVHPTRTLSQADIAQAIELLEHGLPLSRVARLANVRTEDLQSCIKRARAFGFEAWDPRFMQDTAVAV